jgi:hypothetical protein
VVVVAIKSHDFPIVTPRVRDLVCVHICVLLHRAAVCVQVAAFAGQTRAIASDEQKSGVLVMKKSKSFAATQEVLPH